MFLNDGIDQCSIKLNKNNTFEKTNIEISQTTKANGTRFEDWQIEMNIQI